jgi:hypothetical protein
MTMVKDRQKRVVAKAYDGAAAVNARLMTQAAGEGLAESYEEIVALLELDIGPRDCHRLSGRSLGLIRAIAKERGLGNQRPGRPPESVAGIFASVPSHLWLSVFLDRLDRLRAKSPHEFVSSTTFLDALYATRMSCLDPGAELGGRYLIVAAKKFVEGELFLMNCRCCGVRHVRSNVDLKLGVGQAGRQGSCPNCKFLAWLRRDAARVDLAQRTSPTIEEGDLTPAMDAKRGRENFDALIGAN